MYQKGKHAYADDKGLRIQIAHLLYKSDNCDAQFVFTVILPERDVSLNEVEQKLTLNSDLMQKVLNYYGTTAQELHLYLPKFKMEAAFQLNDALQQLGITNAFSESKADFTGIVSKQDDSKGLVISKVKDNFIKISL